MILTQVHLKEKGMIQIRIQALQEERDTILIKVLYGSVMIQIPTKAHLGNVKDLILTRVHRENVTIPAPISALHVGIIIMQT